MYTVLGIALVILASVQTAVQLWRERDSIRSAINRCAGKKSRERVAQQVLTDADRREAAKAAKELENFMFYDGTPQQPIDVERLPIDS